LTDEAVKATTKDLTSKKDLFLELQQSDGRRQVEFFIGRARFASYKPKPVSKGLEEL
jgi:hypothetical protein